MGGEEGGEGGEGSWGGRLEREKSQEAVFAENSEKPDPGEVEEERDQGCGVGWSGAGPRGSIRILLTVNTVGGQRSQRTGLLLGKMLGAGGGGDGKFSFVL